MKTPGFKRIKNRDLPSNAFIGGARIRRDPGGSVVKRYSDGTTESWVGSCGKFFPTIPSAMGSGFLNHNSSMTRSRAEDIALSRCANMKINIAQAFAERKQTANLLINNVNRFVSLAVLFRKGRFSEANRVLGRRVQLFNGKKFPRDTLGPPDRNTFANLWLEYSYGWRPLLSDIYGAAEHLAQLHTKSRPTKVSGSATDKEEIAHTYSEYGVTAKSIGQVNYKAQCRLYFDIASYEIDTLKSTGISNPSLLAWELLPYSFVVDWFLPVGNYLKNLNASSGLRFVKGSTSILSSGKEAASHLSNVHDYIWSGYECSEEWAIMERVVLNSFPSAKLPSFSYGLNLSQVTSGLALLSQLFRR